MTRQHLRVSSRIERPHPGLRQREALDGLDPAHRAGRARRAARARPAAARPPRCESSPASTRPTSGTVWIAGRDVTRVPASKRDMGMVFQAYSLFPHLTALDNVDFGLKMRGKRRPNGVAAARHARPRRPVRRTPTSYASPAVRRSAAARRAGAGAGDRPAACCCSTSRCRRSTPRCAPSCATRSAASSSRSARPRCSSPTTRRRRWPSPTGSA